VTKSRANISFIISLLYITILTGCASYPAAKHLSDESQQLLNDGEMVDRLFGLNVLFGGAEAFDANYFELIEEELQNANIDYQYKPAAFNGVNALKYTSESSTPLTGFNELVFVYFHGGAYNTGSARSMPSIPVLLSRATNRPVYAVDYRTAEIAPYPAATDDAMNFYRGLLDSGVSAENIVFIGDSSGGGLATVTAIHAQQSEIATPKALILFSPWLDLTQSGDSYHTLSDADPLLGFGWAGVDLVGNYAGDIPASSPSISPLFADLTRLPPTLIQVGSRELLLSDSLRFYQKAKRLGNHIELDVWDGMWHVFQALPSLPESQESYREVINFLISLQ